VADVIGDEAAGVVGRQGREHADAVALEGLVPAFDFAVRLHCQLHPIWTVRAELFGSSIRSTRSSAANSPL